MRASTPAESLPSFGCPFWLHRSVSQAVDCKVDYLRHHTIFLGVPVEEKKAWEPITDAKDMPKKPNFYVHCPTRTDPTAAPPGCESIMVLFPVANMQEMAKKGFKPSAKGELYGDLRAAARAKVLERFKEAGCDIEQHIVEETFRDPEEIEELFNLQHGATFGLSHGLLPWQGGLAMTRPAPRAPEAWREFAKECRREGSQLLGAMAISIPVQQLSALIARKSLNQMIDI